MQISDISVNIQGNAQIPIAGAAQAHVTAGVYDLWSTTDTYVKCTRGLPSMTASDVTSATGYLVRAGTTVAIHMPSAGNIGVSAAAFIHKVA